MDELTIQTHDFNDAKRKLKEFSEKIPSSVALEKVDTNSGLFKLFDHNVTGDELNKLTTQIQVHLIAINKLHIETMKEFGQVYKALEALDKDYIQAIILSIKAAEKASNQAKESAIKAEKNCLDIAKTLEVQKQTINVLKQFKEQIDKYERLKNINEIWDDCQTFRKDIRSINSIIESQKEEFDSRTKEQMNYIRNLRDEDKMNYEKQSKIVFKKMKLAYILAVSSVGFTLINFVLQILGII